jgi:hypothetical protein
MKNTTQRIAALTAIALLALPLLAFAEADNESAEGSCNDEMSEGMGCGSSGPNNSYGSYSYPYTSSYSYPSSSQYQTQYQTSYPSYGSNSYNTYAASPAYTSSNSYAPTQSNLQTYPYSHATPTGRYDAFGTPLCMWSDYPGTAMPCGADPQQWIFDPYSGTWY